MSGTHQAFDAGSVGFTGATYTLGASVFQEPDPSVPTEVEIFQDGTGDWDGIDVGVVGGVVEVDGGKKWLG